ncbi:hypothetical protein EV360DRAFT_77196, partial [Lentinula raphanica]
PWTAKINAKQTEIDVARGERDALIKKIESIRTTLQEAEEHLEKVKSEQEEKVKQLADARSEKAELKHKRDAIVQKLNVRSTRVGTNMAREGLVTPLLEAKSSQAETRSQGKVLDSLTRMQENGQITGFLRKDKPVSNRCVQTTSVVLFSCYSQALLSPPKTPENVPRLFDLITPKDPNCRREASHGQVIETSGAMTGGGGAPMRDGMSTKDSISPWQLQEHEREREQTQAKLEEATAAARSAEAELESLNRSGPEIDLRYEKLGFDIQQGKSRIEEAEKRLRNTKAQSKPVKNDVARIKVLEDSIARYEVEIKDLKGKAITIEMALQEVEDKIMDIGGSKLMAQKSKVEGLRNHIDLTNDLITKC